ncbi:MAG TPA: PEP/pyruvate-binding domain-containing protein [Bradyrhizobium sp.]
MKEAGSADDILLPSALVCRLASVQAQDVASAGGKAAALARLIAAAQPVPDGFVVLKEAFALAVDNDKLIRLIAAAASADLSDPRAVYDLSQEIRKFILATQLPAALVAEIRAAFARLDTSFVAVRSSAVAEDSATESWAGQLETFLCVTRNTLIERILGCWASLFSPAALLYALQSEIGSDDPMAGSAAVVRNAALGMAVVVQTMVDADVAGVAFSMHPVTADPGLMLIEAVAGMGSALVGGEVTPDRYVVRKSSGEIVERHIARQRRGVYGCASGQTQWRDIDPKIGLEAKLSDAQILQLCGHLEAIAAFFTMPVDVEWAWSGGRLFILQSRPITSLAPRGSATVAPTAAPASTPGRPDLPQNGEDGRYFFSWAEDCSLLTTDVWMRQFSDHPDMLGSGARDVLLFTQQGHVSTYLGVNERDAAAVAGRRILAPSFLSAFLTNSAAAKEAFAALLDGIDSLDISTLSAGQLYELIKQYVFHLGRLEAHSNVSQPEFLVAAEQRLHHLLQERLGQNNRGVMESFITLTTPTVLDDIRQEEMEVLKLALAVEHTDDELLWRHARHHPWLFPGTYDRNVMLRFLRRRLSETRNQGETICRSALQQLIEAPARQERALRELLRELGDDSEIAYLSRVFRELAIDRLRLKNCEVGGEYLFLPVFEQIAGRAQLSAEQLLMSYRIGDYEALLMAGRSLPPAICESRQRVYLFTLSDGTLSFADGDTAIESFNALIGGPSAGTSDMTVTGTVANLGRAVGPAHIVRASGVERLLLDLDRFLPGEVLITTMLQPIMLGLARKASAIVTDEGGITSHAAIVARELGIPCVVGTGTACQMFKNGDRVEVDAERGIVRLLDPAPTA